MNMNNYGIKMNIDGNPKMEKDSNQWGGAYLGPKLWEKPITLPFNADDYFVMNISEFLEENNLQETPSLQNQGNVKSADQRGPSPMEEGQASPIGSPGSSRDMFDCPMGSPSNKPIVIKTSEKDTMEEAQNITRPSIIVMNKGSDSKKRVENSFLYAESKRAKQEREKEERKRRMQVEIDFAPEDLALATLPGADFNPRERVFDMDELRPQPIIRKKPKVFVGSEKKDGKYYENRSKNNVAARRSREARRLKENQIALRAAYLEKENNTLKKKIEEATFINTKNVIELDILRNKLAKYESFSSSQNPNQDMKIQS